jgi:hypothetical protein
MMLNLAIASGVFVLALLLLRFQRKLPAKGTSTASHTLRPYCLHSITVRYYSLDQRLQTTS